MKDKKQTLVIGVGCGGQNIINYLSENNPNRLSLIDVCAGDERY